MVFTQRLSPPPPGVKCEFRAQIFLTRNCALHHRLFPQETNKQQNYFFGLWSEISLLDGSCKNFQFWGRADCGVYNSVIARVLFLTKCALFVFRTFLVLQLPFNRNEQNRKLLTCGLTNTFCALHPSRALMASWWPINGHY